jgi:hypothetical protein
VDVVAGDVLDREVALVHRHDVRVERGRRVGLVPRDLHDRADLAAELVAGAVAVVGGVPPFLDELLGERAVALGADLSRRHPASFAGIARL